MMNNDLRWVYQKTPTMLEYDPPEFFSAFKHLDSVFQPFPGMFCSVVGTPGSGKSRWSMHFAAQMARKYGHKTAILSMEMLPYFVGKCLRAYSKAWETPEVEDLVYRLHPSSMPSPGDVLELVERATDLQWLIIDPWNQIEATVKFKSVEQEQKDKLQQIANIANRKGIGIMVVTHPTKAIQGEDGKVREPTPYDIAGSAHWANRSDYVLGLTRNRDHGTVKFSSLKVRHETEDMRPGHQMLKLSDRGLYIKAD